MFKTATILERGDRVYLEGCLDYRTYTMTDTGNEYTASFIRPTVIAKFKKGEKRETAEEMSSEKA